MGEIILKPSDVLSSSFDTNNIQVEKIDLSSINQEDSWAYRLRNVFTQEECEKLIDLTEEAGYVVAAVNYGDSELVNEDYRKGYRVLIDDPIFVEKLMERIKNCLPSNWKGHHLMDINERLRFLKYGKDGKFEQHSDAHYSRPDRSAISFITLQMYLNEGFQGGETTLLSYSDENARIPVVPEEGMILAFDQDLLHEGSIVKEGLKYTVRTDVMYTHKYQHS